MQVHNPDLPEGDKPELDLAGFDAAVLGATETEPTLDKAVDVDAPPPDVDLVEEIADPNDPKLKNDPADELPPGEKPKDKKPAETPPADAPKDEAPKDEAVEKEIGDLKLGDKAAARFRDLSGQVRDFAPIKGEMEKLGIKSVQDLTEVAQRAQIGVDMVEMVRETGANSDQYGMTLDYLGLMNKAAQGDTASAEKAFEIASKEYMILAAMLGKDVSGDVDPLAAHADLAQAVEDGDITRKHALEVVKARTQGALAQGRNEQQRQTQTAQQQEQVRQQAHATGVQSLNALGAEWQKADPAGYAHKLPVLQQLVGAIKATTPPNEWAERTKQAYASLANMTPAPAAKPPAPGPVRPGAPGGQMVQQVYDDPFAALEAGIGAASN